MPRLPPTQTPTNGFFTPQASQLVAFIVYFIVYYIDSTVIFHPSQRWYENPAQKEAGRQPPLHVIVFSSQVCLMLTSLLILITCAVVSAFGMSLMGSLSPFPQGSPSSSPDACGPIVQIIGAGTLLPTTQDYNVTACGAFVYYWNATHMFGMGSNHGGQLGSPSFGAVDTRCVGAVPITAFSDANETVEGLTCSNGAVLVWTVAGNVYGWGSNEYNQLGLVGDNLALPTKLAVWSEPVASISMGMQHVLALSKTGKLICWGISSKAQCGRMIATPVWPATQLTVGVTPVASYAAGTYHSVAATEDGLVYAWGSNDNGESCRYIQGFTSAAPPQTSLSTPITASALYGRPVVQVFARQSGTFMLTDEGRLFGCGKNTGGGYGGSDWWVDRPREIFVLPSLPGGYNSVVSRVFTSATASHTLVVTNDLALAATGANSVGQLSYNSTMLVSRAFLPVTAVSAPVISGTIGGSQSVVSTDASVTPPTKITLPPQCQIQGCSCPQPLADAICVNGQWTGPEITIWGNTTINQTVSLIGNLTLAPGSSLVMPIGFEIHVKGCTQFYGGIINYTASAAQLLQYVETPLFIINTTCSSGAVTVVVSVSGPVDPCNYTVFNGATQGPEGYFLTFSQVTCKANKTWIIGVTIGCVAGVVIVLLAIVFLVPKVRLMIFPFWGRTRGDGPADDAGLPSREVSAYADV